MNSSASCCRYLYKVARNERYGFWGVWRYSHVNRINCCECSKSLTTKCAPIGSTAAHAQLVKNYFAPETKWKVRPKKKYARAGAIPPPIEMNRKISSSGGIAPRTRLCTPWRNIRLVRRRILKFRYLESAWISLFSGVSFTLQSRNLPAYNAGKLSSFLAAGKQYSNYWRVASACLSFLQLTKATSESSKIPNLVRSW